jgi:diguanylate cyclase (GGDEF)-like protein
MIAAIVNWFRNASRARRDFVIIAVLSVPLYALIVAVDAFDVVFAWIIKHASYELEEFLALLFCLGLASVVYGYRRVGDLRQEVSQRQRAEQEVHWLARHDPLTGLPNRRCFLEDLRSLTGKLSSQQGCALLLIDLDRFKPINDLFGHRLGDEVLRVVAKRLRELVGDHGIVARLGGDEFGILLRYAKGDDRPVRLARRLVRRRRSWPGLSISAAKPAKASSSALPTPRPSAISAKSPPSRPGRSPNAAPAPSPSAGPRALAMTRPSRAPRCHA